MAEFNRLTVAVPMESFEVKADIRLDEAIPIVREYIVRLIAITSGLSIQALRDFFGFTHSELLAELDALVALNLLEVRGDDTVGLTQYGLSLVDESPDGHVRIGSVEQRQETVHFELLTYSPLKTSGVNLSDSAIKIEVRPEELGSSIDNARRAYKERYADIHNLRGRNTDRGVYSVRDCISKGRRFVPISVPFVALSDGRIGREPILDALGRRNEELAALVRERVADSVALGVGRPDDGLGQFVETFSDTVLPRFLGAAGFDFDSYLREVHGKEASAVYPKGVKPLFGNLYLERNRKDLIARLARLNIRRPLKPALWMPPDYPLWGRGLPLQETLRSIYADVREGGVRTGAELEVHLIAKCEEGSEHQTLNLFRFQEMRHLHFVRPKVGRQLMDGRLELFVIPGRFVAALYHLSPRGSEGFWAPVGIASVVPQHVHLGQRLLMSVLSGPSYGGKAQMRGQPLRRLSLDEGLPFVSHGLDARDEEESEEVEDLPDAGS